MVSVLVLALNKLRVFSLVRIVQFMKHVLEAEFRNGPSYRHQYGKTHAESPQLYYAHSYINFQHLTCWRFGSSDVKLLHLPRSVGKKLLYHILEYYDFIVVAKENNEYIFVQLKTTIL